MRELFVRACCLLVNLVVGEPKVAVTKEEAERLALARANDPYFHAFRARCMQWVYGDDPRRAIVK